MSLAAKIAEIEAILENESGWPSGYWDPTIKMVEASSAVLMMPDAELHELSGRYMATDRIGTTAKELMAEAARRRRLTAHERMAEAAARRRLREPR
ncbi:MAG: hypothetical protein KDK03_09725 [Rhodobacteraceae bacterium]|nr:hypothetical protein [Paracoccaceae bacterium]